MADIIPTHQPFGTSRDTSEQRRAYHRADGKKLYDWWWQKASKRHLEAHPLCVMCEAEGVTEAATRVDHVVPHRGDEKLFRDTANWQSLCTTHHQSDKQRMEKRAQRRGKR